MNQEQKKFGRDLSVGSIPRHLLAISVPMLIGSLLHTGYGIINTIWVGKIIGEDAVAATAVSFPVFFIFIAIAGGSTMATSILVAQYYGARKNDMVQKTVNNSFALSILLAIVLTVGAIIFGDLLLKAMNTPASVFALASSYFRILACGFIFMFLSFLVTSILRGIGDTKTPLIFMAAGVALNALLDPLLIIGIGPFPKLGLNGAAVASVASSAASLFVALVYLNRKSHIVAFRPTQVALDKTITGLIFKIGFPSMIQQSLVSIGGAFIVTFINAYGNQAIAAYGAASRLEGVAFMPIMSIGMASSVLTGQNLGAGKPERVKSIFKWGVVLSLCITGTLVAAFQLVPHVLMQMFVSDPVVIHIGEVYLRIVPWGYLFFAVMFVTNGVINGSGHTLVTMFFTMFSLWILRIPLAAFLSHTRLGITGIWFAIGISFCVIMMISVSYYASGKWKKAVKGMGPVQPLETAATIPVVPE